MTASVPACADYAPATWECPACHAVCRRHSVYTRKVKDISLDGPVTHHVRVGNYRCDSCQQFFKPELPFAGKGKRYTDRAVRKATVAIQEDKTTYTGLPRRLARDFSIKPAKSTGWAWFQRFAGGIDVEEYLRWACGRFSGQLSVDSVSDGDMQMWFATDPLNRDLILGYSRAKNANGETLAAFLVQLRDLYGIRPRLFTCDDANVFDSTPGQVWPGVPVQLRGPGTRAPGPRSSWGREAQALLRVEKERAKRRQGAGRRLRGRHSGILESAQALAPISALTSL